MAIDLDYIKGILQTLGYKRIKSLDSNRRLRLLRVYSDLEDITNSDVVIFKTEKGCYAFSLPK